MPLQLKTLQEASVELGIPMAEIKAMVDLRKIRAVLKRGKMSFAPDELAKIRRLRKSLPESATKSDAAEVAAQAKPAQPATPVRRPQQPKRYEM